MDRKIIKDYLENNNSINNRIGYKMHFYMQREYNEFFNSIKEFSNLLKDYGYTVEISIKAIDGGANDSTLTLKLTPWEEGMKFLTATWNDKDNTNKLYYVINPKFDEDFVEEANGKNVNMYIPVLPFVFLQIYEQKDVILNKFRIKAFNDIEEKIRYKKELNRLYDEIKSNNTNDFINFEQMIKELNNESDKLKDKILYGNMESLKKEQKKFFEFFEQLAKDIKGYGHSIKIQVPIYSIYNEKENYNLEFSYFREDSNKMLVGYSDSDKVGSVCLYDVIDPDFSRDNLTEKEIAEEKRTKNIYLSIPEHIFLQLYSKRAIFYELIEKQLHEDIRKRADFDNKLFEIYRKN